MPNLFDVDWIPLIREMLGEFLSSDKKELIYSISYIRSKHNNAYRDIRSIEKIIEGEGFNLDLSGLTNVKFSVDFEKGIICEYCYSYAYRYVYSLDKIDE